MFRITRFHEVLKGLPRGLFDRLVEARQADKHSKGFSSRDQLIAMIFAQLSGASSLRALETSFNQHPHQHYHLGTGPIRRSTLAEANAKRDSGLFLDLCEHMMGQVQRTLRKQVKAWLYLLDSTPISLKGHGFDGWTQERRTHRTQGLKLHLLLNAQAQIPAYINLTAANVNDVTDAQRVPLSAGATYVFDKGYCDYGWWWQIEQAQARFVTRFKSNAALAVVEARPCASEQILSDEIVRFSNRHPGGGRRNPYEKPLRRISVARPDKPTPLILATNDLTTPAEQIAALYKQRWEIELFFKWIKQNLKLKRFLGRSEQAVRTQLLTALIAYLLLALYRHRHGSIQSLRECRISLAGALFQRPAIDDYLLRKRRREQAQLQALQPALPL